MSALSFKINAETKKLNSFIASLERLQQVLEGIPSGTKEFDVINHKIAEMESRVEQSLRKIAQMQGDAARAVAQTATSATINVPSGDARGGSDAVNEEAKAYRELLDELHLVKSFRDQNIRDIQALISKNAELSASLKELNNQERKGVALSDQQKAKRTEYSLSLEENKIAISRHKQELANQIKFEQAAVGSINEMAQALGRMRTVYRSLNESERGSAWGKNLLNQIESLDTKVKSLDASMGVHARNVGNYASGFNALGFQVQQVARELPSLAYGPQIFFAAISNNLPMLADEIKRARVEYDNFIKSGQKATPVWKQMLSSIFSWQTLLVAGLTVLTIYGKEITEWVGSLFKGKTTIDAATVALERFNYAMVQGSLSAQAEITKLDLLYKAATDLSKPYAERVEAVKKLQDIFPAYFGNMAAEQIMVGNAVGAYEDLRDAIIQVAEAKAAEELITEDKKSLKLIEKTGRAYKNYSLILKEYRVAEAAAEKAKKNRAAEDFVLTPEFGQFLKAKKNLNRFKEEFISALSKMGDEGDKLWERIEEDYDGDVDAFIVAINAGIERLAPAVERLYTTLTPDELNAKAKKARQEAENAANKAKTKQEKDLQDLEKALKKLRDDALQAEIDAMADGTAKRVAQVRFDYKKREEAITEAEQQIIKLRGRLTEDEESKIARLRKSNKEQSTKQQIDVMYAPVLVKWKEGVQAQNEYLLEYGTYRERLQATKDKYDRQMQEAGTEGEKAQIAAERDAALAQLEVEGSEWAQQLADMTVKQLQEKIAEAQQLLDAAQSAYDNLESSDTEEAVKLRDTINQLKAKLALMQNQANKAKKAVSDKDWKEGAELLNDIASTAREAAEALGELDETLGKIAKFIATTASAAGNLVTTLTGVQAASSAAGAAMSAMEKASVVLAAISAAFQLINAALSLFMGKSKETQEYEALVLQYSGLIDIWDELLDKKREYISESWGEELSNASQEALDLIKKQEEVARMLARARLKAGASAGSHSYGYRMWEGSYKFDGQNWQDVADEISEALGVSITSMESFTELSAEDLAWIRKNYAGFWANLDEETRKYFEDIIKYGDEAADVAEQWKEQLTGISFDGMRDGFLDLMLDMESSSEDFAENFEKSLQKAILTALVGQKYQQRLKDLYEKWAKMTDEGNELTPEEVEELRKEYNGIVEDALKEREQMMKDFGWENDPSAQKATSRGFEGMSQEVGSELNGRFTDIQGKVTDIRGFVMAQTLQILAILNACRHIELIQVDTVQVGHELLRYAVMTYMEVVEINSTTKNMLKVLNSMDERLSGIERNTSEL